MPAASGRLSAHGPASAPCGGVCMVSGVLEALEEQMLALQNKSALAEAIVFALLVSSHFLLLIFIYLNPTIGVRIGKEKGIIPTPRHGSQEKNRK